MSKWTAVTPVDRQKHFIVTACAIDEETQKVVNCTLEAVMTKKQFELLPEALKDQQAWRQGWL
jgi:tryptophan-rich hypothetical protein